MLVEVCANSLQSALNAQAAGAERVELCSELGVGGVTPSHGLIKLVKEKLSIPVHVLIRPRSAHFTYSETEFEVMKADVEFCKDFGVDGIVSGVLRADFSLDVEKTKTLVTLTKPLHFTFHRAFDWVANPFEALRQLEELGVDTVLTSGQSPSAEEGIEDLRSWQSNTKMTLMAGGGVSAGNAHRFKEAGLKAIHLSGTAFRNEVSIAGKIPMNSEKHLEEKQVAETNEALVRQVIGAVK